MSCRVKPGNDALGAIERASCGERHRHAHLARKQGDGDDQAQRQRGDRERSCDRIDQSGRGNRNCAAAEADGTGRPGHGLKSLQTRTNQPRTQGNTFPSAPAILRRHPVRKRQNEGAYANFARYPSYLTHLYPTSTQSVLGHDPKKWGAVFRAANAKMRLRGDHAQKERA